MLNLPDLSQYNYLHDDGEIYAKTASNLCEIKINFLQQIFFEGTNLKL